MNVWEHITDDLAKDIDYCVNSDTMYPAMIAEIVEVIKYGEAEAAEKLRQMGITNPEIVWIGEGDPPEHITLTDLSDPTKFETRPCPIHTLYMPQAVNLPGAAWEDALKHYNDHLRGSKEDRAKALNCARLWFTELLHRAIHHRSLSMRITRSENNNQYRLDVDPSVIGL